MKKSRKEFIIEAHKEACEEWKLKIEKEFPKLFKEGSFNIKTKSINTGEYWFHSTGVLEYVLEVSKKHGGTVKTNPIHNCITDNKFSFHAIYTMVRQATEEEVFEALKKEAIKRGYKEGVMCVFGDFKDIRTITSNVFIYCHKSNRLALGKDVIFNKGKWAEIIETTITKKEAEEKLGCKIIG